jgi:signal transduction histidine kinase
VALAGPLWRAIAVFRVASLGYAFVLVLQNFPYYRHPMAGWVVLAVMGVWTAYAVYAYAEPRRRQWPLLVADLTITAGCLLATGWVERPDRIADGVPTLTMTLVAAPVLAWAVTGGKRRGAMAALLLGLADLTVRGSIGLAGFKPDQAVFNGTVLLFLAGIAVGHVAKLAHDAEQRLARAVELEAATRERERLARRIHDSVLQVLALVRRRGAEMGGEAAELGRLAGEQEAALRGLIAPGGDPERAADGVVDLRVLLNRLVSETVTVASPATPVRLAGGVAGEVRQAVGAAIDNVGRHCGERARAWVLIEEDGDTVCVTVRDEGPGFASGRLEEAERAGRLGVAHSIRGRIRELGGTVTITSVVGEGTEVELRVPRSADPAGPAGPAEPAGPIDPATSAPTG